MIPSRSSATRRPWPNWCDRYPLLDSCFSTCEINEGNPSHKNSNSMFLLTHSAASNLKRPWLTRALRCPSLSTRITESLAVHTYPPCVSLTDSIPLVSKTTPSELNWVGAQVSGPRSAMRASSVPLDRRVDASHMVRESRVPRSAPANWPIPTRSCTGSVRGSAPHGHPCLHRAVSQLCCGAELLPRAQLSSAHRGPIGASESLSPRSTSCSRA